MTDIIAILEVRRFHAESVVDPVRFGESKQVKVKGEWWRFFGIGVGRQFTCRGERSAAGHTVQNDAIREEDLDVGISVPGTSPGATRRSRRSRIFSSADCYIKSASL